MGGRLNNDGLTVFALGFLKGERGKEAILRHRDDIAAASPGRVADAVDAMVEKGGVTEETKKAVNRFMNAVSPALMDRAAVSRPPAVLRLFAAENESAQTLMVQIKSAFRAWFTENAPPDRIHLRELLALLGGFELHYVKKETILFSLLERRMRKGGCLPLMWSYHDDFRAARRNLMDELDETEPQSGTVSVLMGRLTFAFERVRSREDLVLFPIAVELLEERDWDDMLAQCSQVGWWKTGSVSAPPAQKDDPVASLNVSAGRIQMPTGSLDLRDLVILLDSLPVDITVVDAEDRVTYFSEPRHRVFPRTKAILGRLVQNCHPPHSVHVVNELLTSFRAGLKNSERFWLKKDDAFIVIDYIALRDENGAYRGTVEVTRDIHDLRTLVDEKRLLSE